MIERFNSSMYKKSDSEITKSDIEFITEFNDACDSVLDVVLCINL